MENSVFEKLYNEDVSSYIEKKNGLNYVSWAYAWALIKKNYPTATYTIYENASGCFYHTDGKTCWVKTGVTIEGIEHIEYLPVMDNRNNSIPLNQVTSFDVNKAIQRSLTKACARHGLGLKVYAGEDLPEDIREYICSECGTEVKGVKTKDGAIKTAKEVLDACGGLCVECYKKKQKENKVSE